MDQQMSRSYDESSGQSGLRCGAGDLWYLLGVCGRDTGGHIVGTRSQSGKDLRLARGAQSACLGVPSITGDQAYGKQGPRCMWRQHLESGAMFLSQAPSSASTQIFPLQSKLSSVWDIPHSLPVGRHPRAGTDEVLGLQVP